MKTKTKAADGAETDAASDQAVTPKTNRKAPKSRSRPTRQSARTAKPMGHAKPIDPFASDSEPLTELDTDQSNRPEDDVFVSNQKRSSIGPDSSANPKPRPKPRFEPNERQQEAEGARIPAPTSPQSALNIGSEEQRAGPLSDDEMEEDARDEEGKNVSENDGDMGYGSSLSSPPRTPLRQKRPPSPADSEGSLADFTTSRKRVRR